MWKVWGVWGDVVLEGGRSIFYQFIEPCLILTDNSTPQKSTSVALISDRHQQ
ncbi:MAG: hypothetical protein AB4080_00790 [Trichodesmium sp.]